MTWGNKYLMREWIDLFRPTLSEAYVTTLTKTFRVTGKEVYAEAFLNPTSREIAEMRALITSGKEPVKGLLLPNDDVVMWAHHLFHHEQVERDLDLIQQTPVRLMFEEGQIAFYSTHSRSQNAQTIDRILENRYLNRWGFSRILNDLDEVLWSDDIDHAAE